MPTTPPTLYFDFVDPLSYLVELELATLPDGDAASVVHAPFELRPPPTPLVGLDAPELASRWATARASAEGAGVAFAPPALVPWTRKAHELHALAREREMAPLVRSSVFEAYMLRGLDIGRVDVLVDIAREAGLDVTEAKAVLDVDRHEAEVAEARTRALDLGIEHAPTLVLGSGRLEGFHNREAIGTFLGYS